MRNWIKSQYKAVLIALFFMFLTIGFAFAGVGCNAISGLARDVQGMSDGIAKTYQDSKRD